jgi:mannose-6-phosphate isomerase-like protein (cupin superfamily)
MSVKLTDATYAKLYEAGYQWNEPSNMQSWVARGANFSVAITPVKPGDILSRENNPDEYMVLLQDTSATIRAGDEQLLAATETLTIVPPGASSITSQGTGRVIRFFSTEANDVADKALNRDIYANGAPGVAPLVSWPMPVGGYKLRNYRPSDYAKEGNKMRLFRSRNLMINVLAKREVPRDVTALSPHTHADFEQGSLALSGTYVHHMRYPWGPDMTTWQEDEHVELGSPSLLVVPPTIVHTSMNIGTETGWLIDLFAPPRMDFSKKPGMVCNENDYPLPPVE